MEGFAPVFIAVSAHWKDYRAMLQTEHNVPSTPINYLPQASMFMLRKNPLCYSPDFRNDEH